MPPAPPSTLSPPMRVPYTLAGVNLSMGKKGSPPLFKKGVRGAHGGMRVPGPPHFFQPLKIPPIFPGSRVPGMRGRQGDRYGQDLDVGRRLPLDTQDRVLSMSGPCASTAPMCCSLVATYVGGSWYIELWGMGWGLEL